MSIFLDLTDLKKCTSGLGRLCDVIMMRGRKERVEGEEQENIKI